MKSSLSHHQTQRDPFISSPLLLQTEVILTLSLTHTHTLPHLPFSVTLGEKCVCVCVSHFHVKLSDVKEVVNTHTHACLVNYVSEKYL